MERGDLPEAVRLPDGRTEPFEPERITRTLFAAGERIGRPDAFRARELTESVLHVLTSEDLAPVTFPEQISQVVAKVVRELGHPDLARAYEGRSDAPAGGRTVWQTGSPEAMPDWLAADPLAVRARLAGERLRSFSLDTVYPPDLVSAHAEGLVQLTGLDHPCELDAAVASLETGRILEGLTAGRRAAGGALAVDGPEFVLAGRPGDPTVLADDFLREARFAAEALGVTLILNLNPGTPPPRLSEPSGPLFGGRPDPRNPRRHELALALARQAIAGCFDVWWHLPADGAGFADAPAPVVERALAGQATQFVFDRARFPVALGAALDRECPAVLTRVGVNLARLVDLMGGPPVDPDGLLRKVASLTRFAKTAGHVKQDFLRRHGPPPVREAFLVDRARLVLAPTGVGAAAASTERPPVEFARDVVRAIRLAAETDRPRVMPVRVEVALGPDFLTAIDSGSGVRPLVRAAGQLHSAGGGGLLELSGCEGGETGVAQAREAIRVAAESAVTRLRFAPPAR